MKNVLPLIITIVIFTAVCIPADKPAGYLFAHMLREDYGRLYYSISKDGLHWKFINEGNRVNDDYKGHPDITLGHDGRYYMTGGSANVTIWVSRDLVTWSKFLDFNPDVYKVPGFKAMERTHGAPKIYYDKYTSQYLVTWHTSEHRKLKEKPEHYWAGQRTLYILSKDLKTFTKPKKLFQYDMATIDVIIRREAGKYYAFIKDELYPSFDWPTGKTIRIAESDSLTGPWTKPGGKITANFREAPTLIPRPDANGWYLYCEQYPAVQYNCLTAPRLAGPWHDVYINDTSLPPNARHGCMITINSKQYDDIMSAYGK